MLSLETILPLVCAIFVAILGWFVFVDKPNSRLNQLFFAFCLAMVFWLLGTFMMFFNRYNEAAAIWWDRFVYIGVTMMPALMHHFSLVFTGHKGQRKLLVFTYIGSLFFLLISRTPYFVDGLYHYSWGVHTKAQIFHHIFLVFFYWGVQIFIVNIWRAYRKSVNPEFKKQAFYVILSFSIVMFIGGTAYLTAYGIDIRYPFSYFSGLAFPFILAYAVTRHHLLGAKVIVSEVLVGLVLFFLVTEIFLSQSIFEIIIRSFFTFAVATIGLLLIRSVTEEVRRREEIQRLAEKLENANRSLEVLNQAKNEFISIASHQLRTPLSIIKGYLSMVLEGDYGNVGKNVYAVLKKVYNSNERLVCLVNDLLNISRIESGRLEYRFEAVNFNNLVEELVREFTIKARDKNLVLKFNYPKDSFNVNIDVSKIREVISNLLDNAIKYTEKGGIIVTIQSGGEGEVILSVQDTGLGIASYEKDKIFEKFTRGQSSQSLVGGLGIGLYICKKFVEGHGGKIWVESDGPGKGSKFIFTLPIKR